MSFGSHASEIIQKPFRVSFRVMLSTAELHWESSGFSTALPVLLQALALARQHHLQSLASETILHLAFTQVCHNIEIVLYLCKNHQIIYCNCSFSFLQLMLGVPEQALYVLHEAIEPILAHRSVMDKGRAMLLAARCQMAVTGFRPNRQGQAGNTSTPHSGTGLLLIVLHGSDPQLHNATYVPADLRLAASVLDTLNEAAAYFTQLNCKERLRDVHYLQAQLHHSLGQTLECNKSAMLFRLLDQELQSPAPPVSMRLWTAPPFTTTGVAAVHH